MIRFNLRKLLGELEAKSGKKITLRQVAADSGCDKNALSRLLNHPDVAPSARVIDDLVKYFFHSFKALDPTKRDDVLMREIIVKFISVYPDDFDIRELEPLREEELEAWENLGDEGRWQLYNHIKYGGSIDQEGKAIEGVAKIGDSREWREPQKNVRGTKQETAKPHEKVKPTKKKP